MIHVPVTVQSIKKIFHISDIHFRLQLRHEEFNEILEKFYAAVKAGNENNDAIICVTGDLTQNKVQMSPELVHQLSNFFTGLGEVAETLVICGNHDLNVKSPDRLDAISPVINALNNPKIHYLRESGVYEVADCVFSVFSVVGSEEDWVKADEIDTDKPKVCLFHAPINGVMVDTGYVIEDATDPVIFDGFDMVIAGDLHVPTVIQEYDASNHKPVIAYGSSTCQQNFGENLLGHGYRVWDVATRTTTFHELPNDYGFYTLRLDSKKLPDISDMPKKVRLRLFTENLTEAEIVKIVALLRSQREIIECVIHRTSTLTTGNIATLGTTIDNISNVDHQNTMIAQYCLATKQNITPETIVQLQLLNGELNEDIKTDLLPQNVRWKPLKMEFDNLFTYGSGNSINFETMHGTYGLFGQNASGKTSVFHALCYMLFDKVPTTDKAKQIMNSRENTMRGYLELDVDGKRYTIERTGKRAKDGTVKADVAFSRMEDDGTLLALNGLERRDTDKIIQSYVGSYEDFVYTSYSVQNANSPFIETGQSARKDLLSRFMGMTIFDQLRSVAMEKSREVSSQLKLLKRSDVSQDLVNVQTKLAVDETAHKYALEQQETAQLSLVTLDDKVKELLAQKVPNVQAIDPKPLEHRQEALERSIPSAREIARLAAIDQEMMLEAQDETIGKLTEEAIVEIVERHTQWTNTNTVLASENRKLAVMDTEIRGLLALKNTLADHEYDPECEYCMRNQFVKDAEQASLKLETLTLPRKELHRNIRKLENDLVVLGDIATEYQTMRELQQAQTRRQVKLQGIVDVLNKAKNELQRQEQELQSINAQLDVYEANEALIEQNRLLDTEIAATEILVKYAKADIKQYQNAMDSLNQSIATLKHKKTTILEQVELLQQTELANLHYDLYKGIVGRDGLPYYLLATMLPEIQHEINNILREMVQFTLQFELDAGDIDVSIVYDSGRTWALELASGMEKFMSGLAIRLALTSVSNIPRCNFICIDEGVSNLDADHMLHMDKFFDLLKTRYEWAIVISHSEIMRDFMDTMLEITREDNYSNIVVE